MLSPDGGANKRSSIRLTLKTSNLVSQSSSQQSPELSSPTSHRPRHPHNTRRNTVSSTSGDDDVKFFMPSLPDRIGHWEEVLLSKFAKLRKLKGSEPANSFEESTVEPTPVSASVSSSNVDLNASSDHLTSPTASVSAAAGGESAREHAIKLVLSGHLRFESQTETSRKVVSSRKRSSLSMARSQPSDFGMFPDEPQEGFLKPAEPEPFSPVAPSIVKIKLPKPAPPPSDTGDSPKAELRKQVFVRGPRASSESVENMIKGLPGYVSHSYQTDRSSAVIDFDSHPNALSAVKSIRDAASDGVDLFVCLTRVETANSMPFEASQFNSNLVEQQCLSSPNTDDDAMQQKWSTAQRRVTPSTPSVSTPTTTTAAPALTSLQSPHSESAPPPMAPRELQTYDDVF